MARRNGNMRSGFGRWDRREVGLRPENALSRVARKFCSLTLGFLHMNSSTRTLRVVPIQSNCLFNRKLTV